VPIGPRVRRILQENVRIRFLAYIPVGGSSPWSFSNQGGAPRLDSPIATNLGAFIVEATNQSVWHLTSQGWQSLGGYIDR